MAHLANAKQLQGVIESDARVDRKRRAARMRALYGEQQLQAEEKAFEAHRRHRILTAEREAAIAEELKHAQDSRIQEEKRMQRVRDEPELRELEKRLNAAYTAKLQANQIAEHELLKKKEIEEEKVLMERLEKERDLQEEYERERNSRRHVHSLTMAEMHREQAEQREEERRNARERYLQEKAEVDAVVARVREETMLEQLGRAEKVRQQQVEHSTFMAQRQEYKELEQRRQQEEEKAIQRFMEERSKRLESDMNVRREREEFKARLLEQQGQAIAAEQSKKEELEQLVIEYYAEQREQRLRQEEAAAQERRRKARQSLIEANEKQIREKQRRKELQAEEELKWRNEMLEQYAKDDRLEQQSRARRAQLKAEHLRKVNDAAAERRRQEEADAARQKILDDQKRVAEEERRCLIAQERARIVAEHAERIAGFVPKGLTAADWEVLHRLGSTEGLLAVNTESREQRVDRFKIIYRMASGSPTKSPRKLTPEELEGVQHRMYDQALARIARQEEKRVKILTQPQFKSRVMGTDDTEKLVRRVYYQQLDRKSRALDAQKQKQDAEAAANTRHVSGTELTGMVQRLYYHESEKQKRSHEALRKRYLASADQRRLDKSTQEAMVQRLATSHREEVQKRLFDQYVVSLDPATRRLNDEELKQMATRLSVRKPKEQKA